MVSFYGRRGIGLASVLALAVVILGVNLGLWQLRRAEEKASLQQAQDRAAAAPALELSAPAVADASPAPTLPAPVSVDGRQVQATGTFVAERSVFLDNRTRESVAGFHVLTPLKLAGRDAHVMVLRGWIPRDPYERSRLPSLTTPAGPVHVSGVAVKDLQQPMMLGEEPEPGPQDKLWQHFEYRKFADWAGIELYPVIVRQTVEPGYRDGLARDWNEPGTSVDRHRAYAFQWFAMTAAAVLTWIILLWRSRAIDVEEGAGHGR